MNPVSCAAYGKQNLLTKRADIFIDVDGSGPLEPFPVTCEFFSELQAFCALDFCNLSGCEQLVRGSTHIAGNRLDLVMTDVPDIVNMVVGRDTTRVAHALIKVTMDINKWKQLLIWN